MSGDDREEESPFDRDGLSQQVCSKITFWAHGLPELAKPVCSISVEEDGVAYYVLSCFRDGNLVQYRAPDFTGIKRCVQSKSGFIYCFNYANKCLESQPKMQSDIDISAFREQRRKDREKITSAAIREITEALSDVGIMTVVPDELEE